MQKASYQKIALNLQFPVRSIEMKTESRSELFYCHYHPNIEIILVTDGSIDMTIDNNSFVLKKGDVAFINPYQIHYGTTLNEGARVHLVVLSYSVLGLLESNPIYLKYLSKLENNTLRLPNKIDNNEIIKNIVINLLAHSDTEIFGKELAVQGYFLLLLSELYQNNLFSKNTNQLVDITSSKDHIILDYIEENYNKTLKIKDLSDKFCFSEDYFTKYFKKLTNQTPISYINNLRIYHSQYLLQTTDLSISEIGFKVGFDSTSYFCKTFKQKCGESPRNFKRKSASRIQFQ